MWYAAWPDGHRLNVHAQAVRFPPRKITPPQPAQRPDEHYAPPSSTPRSPLSPLTSSSPLYPDGLINPIWIRKHVELVPSVFVLFLRLWEPPPPASPLDVQENAHRDEEKRRDTDLAAEIGTRKKATGERGIKLTVVLLASRRMLGQSCTVNLSRRAEIIMHIFQLDDPSLDPRLTLIHEPHSLCSLL